jgi:hypothetical protein
MVVFSTFQIFGKLHDLKPDSFAEKVVAVKVDYDSDDLDIGDGLELQTIVKEVKVTDDGNGKWN